MFTLIVGPVLWPSHGCAWCWRTSPHHPTHQPHQPNPPPHVSQIEWSLVESSRSHIKEEVCSFLSSFIFLWRAVITCPSCSLHILPFLLSPRYSNYLQVPCYIIITIVSLCHHSPRSISIHSPPSCSVLTIAPHEPICPQVQGGSQQRYLSSPPFSYLLPNLPLYSSSVY